MSLSPETLPECSQELAESGIDASYRLRIRTPERARVQRTQHAAEGIPDSFPMQPMPDPPIPQLALDTLFFVFYHQSGTYCQYRAALALQSEGWLYHRKYQTWFKPSSNGSYIYFDYELSWSLKAKPGFVFDPEMQEEFVE